MENAACTHGRKFCRNSHHEGHETWSCFATGGVKEGQGPKGKAKSKSKKKAKEKANKTTTNGGGESDGDDKYLHYVKYVKCLMTHEVDFSDYSLHDGNSHLPLSSLKADDLMFSAQTNSSAPTIIDSSTTLYIHSKRSDFILCSSSSAFINGFGDSKLRIHGHSEAQIIA